MTAYAIALIPDHIIEFRKISAKSFTYISAFTDAHTLFAARYNDYTIVLDTSGDLLKQSEFLDVDDLVIVGFDSEREIYTFIVGGDDPRQRVIKEKQIIQNQGNFHPYENVLDEIRDSEEAHKTLIGNMLDDDFSKLSKLHWFPIVA